MSSTFLVTNSYKIGARAEIKKAIFSPFLLAFIAVFVVPLVRAFTLFSGHLITATLERQILLEFFGRLFEYLFIHWKYHPFHYV